MALLVLGMLHAGLLLSVEAPMRRWLEGARVWTLTLVILRAIAALLGMGALFLWRRRQEI